MYKAGETSAMLEPAKNISRLFPKTMMTQVMKILKT
jgi:hypothetical protein